MHRVHRLPIAFYRWRAIVLAIAVAGISLPGGPAAAKGKMTVKMAPEYTSAKKGSGKAEVAKRDVSSGQATGKRTHKPVRASAKKKTNTKTTNTSHGSLLRNGGGNTQKGGRY